MESFFRGGKAAGGLLFGLEPNAGGLDTDDFTPGLRHGLQQRNIVNVIGYPPQRIWGEIIILPPAQLND